MAACSWIHLHEAVLFESLFLKMYAPSFCHFSPPWCQKGIMYYFPGYWCPVWYSSLVTAIITQTQSLSHKVTMKFNLAYASAANTTSNLSKQLQNIKQRAGNAEWGDNKCILIPVKQPKFNFQYSVKAGLSSPACSKQASIAVFTAESHFCAL